MMKTIWIKRIISSTSGEAVFNVLEVALLFTFLAWFVQYQWKSWKVHQLIGRRKGPLALPIIGSGWYFMGSTDDFLNRIYGLASKYESPAPIWLGNDLYVGIWTTKDMEIVMKSPHALDKNHLYELMEFLVGTGLFTSKAAKWKRHRKIILPTLNLKILEGYVEIFSQKLDILLKQLKKEVGKEDIDICDIISRYSLDILCETAMGVTINAQTDDCNFFKWINRMAEITASRVVRSMYLPDFFFRHSSLGKELMSLAEKFHSFTDTVVQERKLAYQKRLEQNVKLLESRFEEEPFKKRTFLQQLIELSEEGSKFTDEELREEVATFLIAGSDTTSTANCFILVMLGMFPHVQNKVYQEVIDVLGSDRQVEYEDLNSFLYLERVIKETMRLFPVAPFLFRSATGDIKLDDCTIPAGSSVLLNILPLHRNPELWPDPLKFDPDRFLPEEVSKRHPYSYLPFSGGLRSCPGINFAMLSMKSTIAMIVRKYQIFTGYQSIKEIRLKFGIRIESVDGFKVSVEKRK